MRLRLRLVLPASGVRHDVVVAAASGTTVAQLRAALAPYADTEGLPLHVAGDPVPDAAQLGHPPLLEGATLSFSCGPPCPPTTALLQLHVRSGPDCGHVLDLAPGEHLVGRSPGALLRLDDAAVSRAHAIVHVRTQGVTVQDAGSTNGTFLDGSPVGPQPLPFPVGRLLRIGATTLVLHVPQELPAAVRPDASGHLLVNRSPRPASAPAQAPVEFPQPPAEGPAPRLSWVAAVLPLALSAVLAVVLHSPTMLLFGLASPAVLVGQWLGDRRGARRSSRTALEAYAGALASAEERLRAALAQETAARHAVDPEPSVVLAIACRPQSRLWERNASTGLRARVGVGRLPAETGCPGRATPDVGPVPVDVDLDGAAGVAIAGPRNAVLATARAVVGRTATLYSPRELQVLVVAPSEHRADWEWARLLPHAAHPSDAPPQALLDGLASTLAQLAAAPPAAPAGGPRLLVVVDGVARWRPHPGLAAALGQGHRHGVHVLSLDSALPRLPAESSTVLDLTTEPATLRRDADGSHVASPSMPFPWDGRNGSPRRCCPFATPRRPARKHVFRPPCRCWTCSASPTSPPRRWRTVGSAARGPRASWSARTVRGPSSSTSPGTVLMHSWAGRPAPASPSSS